MQHENFSVIKDKKLRRDVHKVVHNIALKYKPQKIVLFGSMARGRHADVIFREEKEIPRQIAVNSAIDFEIISDGMPVYGAQYFKIQTAVNKGHKAK